MYLKIKALSLLYLKFKKKFHSNNTNHVNKYDSNIANDFIIKLNNVLNIVLTLSYKSKKKN